MSKILTLDVNVRVTTDGYGNDPYKFHIERTLRDNTSQEIRDNLEKVFKIVAKESEKVTSLKSVLVEARNYSLQREEELKKIEDKSGDENGDL